MKKRTTILSACLLAAVGIAASDAGSRALHNKVQQDVIANERAVAKAIAAGDERAFATLVASDAITVGPHGVTTAIEEEQHLPAVTGPPWRISDVHVKPIDENVVIVYYRGTEDGPSGAGQPPAAAWHSTVWTRQHGAWVAEYHQQTPIPTDAAVRSTSAGQTVSPMELRDRVRLAKDIARELVNGSHPVSDTAASPTSTLITVDRWPLEQLRNTILDLALVTPATPAPGPGSLGAHVARANAIAAALGEWPARGEGMVVDRTAVERLNVELDALSQLTPLT